MAKIDKVLLVVNLLCNRRLVSMRTIQEVCGISYRTALRYIQTISSAHIPVYYDRKLRGYRLLENDSHWVHDPTLTDVVLLLYSLSFLKPFLNENYKNEIESLVKKIISSQEYRLEDLLSSFDFVGKFNDDHLDASSEINSILLRLAINMGKDLRLTLGKNESAKEITINNPRLWFKKQWKITGDNVNYDELSLLKDIIHISLI